MFVVRINRVSNKRLPLFYHRTIDVGHVQKMKIIVLCMEDLDIHKIVIQCINHIRLIQPIHLVIIRIIRMHMAMFHMVHIHHIIHHIRICIRMKRVFTKVPIIMIVQWSIRVLIAIHQIVKGKSHIHHSIHVTSLPPNKKSLQIFFFCTKNQSHKNQK